MQKSAEAAGVPCVKAWRGTAESLEELLAKIGKEEGLEGCVLRFDDGRYMQPPPFFHEDYSIHMPL